MTAPPIAPGDVQFAQATPVALPAGTRYLLQVTQSVVVGGTTAGPYQAAFTLTPQAPRFSLDASEIFALYPPANASGDYRDVLPQVVFTSPSLPWERTLDGAVAPRGKVTPPWMAILLLQASQDPPPLVARTVGDVLNTGDSAILGPTGLQLEEGQATTDPTMTVDLPAALFSVCAPQLADLPYLAHCRQVGLTAKATPLPATAGWFSAVIGNRLPAPDVSATAYLVSMEGFSTSLPPASLPGTVTAVRMVAFARWSFSDDGALSFVEMMKLVRPGIFCVPPPSPDPSGGKATAALACGYSAHNTTTREGDRTVAWYRGPFVPRALADERITPSWCSDSLVRFDPDIAMFDQSYAIAWEIGRLGALADEQFAEALYQWRAGNQQTVTKLLARILVARSLRSAFRRPTGAAELLQPHFVRRQAGQLWRELGGQVCGTDGEPGVFGPLADASRLRRHQGRMPGLLADDELATLAGSPNPLEAIASLLLRTPAEGT